MATNPITPDFRKITDLGERWLAYREGPFAADCVLSIYEDAKRLRDHHNGLRFADKQPVFTPSPAANYYGWIAAEAVGLYDHLNGEPDMECYLEQFEAALWPEEDEDEGEETPISMERPSAAIFGGYR